MIPRLIQKHQPRNKFLFCKTQSLIISEQLALFRRDFGSIRENVVIRLTVMQAPGGCHNFPLTVDTEYCSWHNAVSTLICRGNVFYNQLTIRLLAGLPARVKFPLIRLY